MNLHWLFWSFSVFFSWIHGFLIYHHVIFHSPCRPHARALLWDNSLHRCTWSEHHCMERNEPLSALRTHDSITLYAARTPIARQALIVCSFPAFRIP